MKYATVIRHVHFEDLGTFEPVLRELGITPCYVDAGTADLGAIDANAAELFFVLGAPIGAYEESLYPFLTDELALIERRLKAARPMIGICLGSQLMARTLGAKVYPSGTKEIGWAPISLTEAGKRSPWRHLVQGKVLHWHGDTFDLPDGATRLASTEFCINQAFTYGENAIGLQFHPEASGLHIERWLIGHACELAQAGISVPALRAETALAAPILAAQARKSLTEWLEQVGLVEEKARAVG
jgi:GMP synthase (glutamine-hydrolysing)